MKIYKVANNESEIKCPFCNEDGFDLIGLKGHLQHGDCEIFNKINISPRHFSDKEQTREPYHSLDMHDGIGEDDGY